MVFLLIFKQNIPHLTILILEFNTKILIIKVFPHSWTCLVHRDWWSLHFLWGNSIALWMRHAVTVLLKILISYHSIIKKR